MIDREFIERVGWARWTRKTVLRSFFQHVLHKDNILTLPTGLQIRLPTNSHFGTEAFKTECDVDWGSERIFADNLDPAGVVLDIGAHIGYYSLYVLPLVKAVHAFEPDPRSHATLVRNLAGRANAHVHQLAVGSCAGKGTFVFEAFPELSHLSGNGDTGCEVDIVSVDSFVSARELPVTGIKIDVEGWDLSVIEGALSTLGSQAPVVLTEARPDSRLFALIAPLAYRVFAFTRDLRARSHPLRGTQFRFDEIADENTPQTKMLFLVPRRLYKRFEGLISK